MAVSVESYLEHYGVKGMKWGVRRDRKRSGSSSSANKTSDQTNSKDTETYKKLLADRPKPSPGEAKANYLKAVKRSEAKTNPSGSSKKEKDFDYEKAAKIAVGAAVAGVVVYAAYQRYGSKGTILPGDKQFATPKPGAMWDGEIYTGPNLSAGQKVSVDLFKEAATVSQKQIWMGNEYLTEHSWNQKEMLLPAGHTFKRLSKAAETGFGDATYTTASEADWGRYLSTFRAEHSGRRFYEVSFQAKKDVKVPDLTTRLNAVKEALDMDHNDALTWYAQNSGSDWSDPRAKSFFSKLVSQGYDAIIDDMDAGIIGEAPLVVINPSAFTDKTSKRVTNGDLRNAAKNLTELANRRP